MPQKMPEDESSSDQATGQTQNDALSKMLQRLQMQVAFNRAVIRKLINDQVISLDPLSSGLLLIKIDENKLKTSNAGSEFNKFLLAVQSSQIPYQITYKTDKDMRAQASQTNDNYNSPTPFGTKPKPPGTTST